MAASNSSRNIRFLWLCDLGDFEKCKNYLYKQISLPTSRWQSFENPANCLQYIKRESNKTNILISSGSYLEDIIHDIHPLKQLDSIYIYCRKKDKYLPLKSTYEKIRNIHDDPIHLLDQICEDIRQSEASLLGPEAINISLPCLFENEIKSYSFSTIACSLWETNEYTTLLPVCGQATIEFWSRKPVAFNLCLSTKLNVNNHDASKYRIVLEANTRKVILETINARDETNESHEVVQTTHGRWCCYWLTFWSKNRQVQYGIGEVRPRFAILKIDLLEQDKASIERISYLHIKLNSTDVNPMEDLKIFIRKEPIIFEPPLLVISPDEFSATHPANNSGVLGPLLKAPLKNFYEECQAFCLVDEHFPDFIKAIESSMRNRNGWCHRKLSQKADRFGRTRAKATYLCLLVKEYKNQFSLIMKIWPPGHYSPIHQNDDIYSIIRVLHGKLLIKYFPILSIQHVQDPLIEQIFEPDSITWMAPKLNQIHQMRNPDMYGPCCITIECIQHTTNEQTFSERFAFLSYHDFHIERYNAKPDEDYQNFKKTMHEEWTHAV